MNSDGNELVAVLTGIAGLIAALIGLLRYFNYRSKRDRMAAVGTAFEAVVQSLADEDEVRQMAAAIRLRRFFDPTSELSTRVLRRRVRRRFHTGDRTDDETTANDGAAPADAAAHRSGRADRRRRLANKELPYAADALNVIVAILRTQPPGNFQKLLADALTRAPKELLDGADLQRANLQDAWLGRIDLSRADFYRADLSNASFKEATAPGAQFYEARLVRTRFTRARLAKANFFAADLPMADFTGATLLGASFDEARAWRVTFRQAQLKGANFDGADLREADFAEADLADATFRGARLGRANFADAENVPPEIRDRLGTNDVHRDDVQPGRAPRKVFLSQPSVLTPQQRALIDRIETRIKEFGGEAVRLPPEEYPPSGSLGEIRRRMSECSGVAIVGMPQLAITEGVRHPGTPAESPLRDVALASPWNEIEAGMAFGLCLPMLAVYEDVDTRGVFGISNEKSLTLLDIRAPSRLNVLDNAVETWLGTLTSY